MKKTLEENNREREILEENSKANEINSKFSSPHKSCGNEKQGLILNDSRKFAAFRASELKKRNKNLIEKY